MIVGLIPARGGSKGIPNKNIRPLGGYPLLAWSIGASKLCGFIEDTIVSTDSPEYAEIAMKYNTNVIMRPLELATDIAGDEGYLLHFLECYKSMYPVVWIVLLRPTTPLRKPVDLDFAVMRIKNHPQNSSLRSAQELAEPVQKMFWVGSNGFYKPIFPGKANLPRQSFTPTYHPNGYVDILKASEIKKGNLYGDKIVPFITDDVGEIDHEEDFEFAEWRLQKYGSEIWTHLKNTYPIRT